MPIPNAVLNELYMALQAVSDVLSKVQDGDWPKVESIQNSVNVSQEAVAQLQASLYPNRKLILQHMLSDDDLALKEQERMAVQAALDLIDSVEVDATSTTDNGESYAVIGNVDTPTLLTLGFEVKR